MPMPYISGLESGGEWRQVYWSATNHNSPMQSSDGAGARRNIAPLGAHHPPAAATAPHAPNDGPNIDPLSPIAAGMEFSGKWRSSSWNENMGPIPLNAVPPRAAPTARNAPDANVSRLEAR